MEPTIATSPAYAERRARMLASQPYVRLWLATLHQFAVFVTALTKMLRRGAQRREKVPVDQDLYWFFGSREIAYERAEAEAIAELTWWWSKGREIATAIEALGVVVPSGRLEDAANHLFAIVQQGKSWQKAPRF